MSNVTIFPIMATPEVVDFHVITTPNKITTNTKSPTLVSSLRR